MESDKVIPAPRSSLGNLVKGGVQALRVTVMNAASSHSRYLGGVQQEPEVRSAQIEAQLMGRPQTTKKVNSEGLERGDDVTDLQRKKKGTIIRVLKAGSLMQYEVVDREGNAWLQEAAKLRRRA